MVGHLRGPVRRRHWAALQTPERGRALLSGDRPQGTWLHRGRGRAPRAQFCYWQRPALFSDTRRFLDGLGVPTCVVSNIDRVDLVAEMEWHALEFDHVVTSEDVRSYKPRPDIFERALNLLGVHGAETVRRGLFDGRCRWRGSCRPEDGLGQPQWASPPSRGPSHGQRSNACISSPGCWLRPKTPAGAGAKAFRPAVVGSPRDIVVRLERAQKSIIVRQVSSALLTSAQAHNKRAEARTK